MIRFTLLTLCLAAQTYGQGLDAVRVAANLPSALYVIAPPGDTGRLFIVRQTGQIHILNLATGTLNSTLFLNLNSKLLITNEQGLLGMAFDPAYASNGKFYLDFVVPGGKWGNGTTHISQYQVSATNRNVADPASEKVLLKFDHPERNHNGGWIGFSRRSGDDHNLYITTGDGGSANDQGTGHIEPGGNAQSLVTLLGKILRIHVNPTTAAVSIPLNNPFYGNGTYRQEIWAYGLRNPWRASFDAFYNRMYIADVGQGTREELDVQKASNPGGGENYEWRLREGKIQTPSSVGGPRPPSGIDPILDYPHTVGQCITGGYVYRGAAIPSLYGIYVFGDYLGAEGVNVGKIFTMHLDGTNFTNITSQLSPTRIGGYRITAPTSFGEDAAHELYITSNGSVFKIVPAP
jgi:glucose/arabinose dehydrogenase